MNNKKRSSYGTFVDGKNSAQSTVETPNKRSSYGTISNEELNRINNKTNPLLQTPALKVWKGDISLQQGIKETNKQEELRTMTPSRTYDEGYVQEVKLRDEMKKAEQNLEDAKANDNRNILEKILQFRSSIDPVFNAKKDYNKAKKDYEDYKAVQFYSSIPNGEAKTTNPNNKRDIHQSDKTVDWLHEYINNFNDYRKTYIAKDYKDTYDKYAFMNDREIGIYNYLYNTDVDKAKEFLDFLDDDLTQRLKQKNLETVYDFTSKNAGTAIIGSVASVPINLMSAGEQVGNTLDYLLTGEIKENYSSQFASTMRGAVTDKYDMEINGWDAFDFVYNTGMSTIDSIAASTTGNLGAATLGLSAAAGATNDIISRGGTDSEAFWAGVAAGTFEWYFERYSLGQLEVMKDSVGSGLKVYASNMAKSMIVNCSEETATETANILYDIAANGSISQYAMLINEYMQKNPNADEKEARNYAAIQLGLQIAEAGISGALMGFGFGAAGSVYSHKNANSIGKIIAANGMENQVVDLALKTDKNSTAYKIAEKISNSGNMSSAQIGNLAVETMSELSEAKTNVISSAVYNRMVDLGVNESKASTIKENIASALNKKDVKQSTIDSLKSEPAIKQIVNETQNPENNPWVVEMSEELEVVENAISQIEKATTFSQSTSTQANTEGQETQPLQNGDEGVVAPVEEGVESAVSPQKERNIGFTEPDAKTIYREPTAQENDEAIFGKRKTAADFGGVDTTKGKHLNKAQQDEIIAIGEKLGRKVVYEDFSGLDKFKGKKKIPDGYLAKDGTVHINYFAKRPIYFLFKHEITHYLKKSLASYNDFMNLVIDSNAFKDWLDRNGYTSIDALKTEIMDTYSEVEGFDESRCYDEILANFVGEYLFGGENAVNQKLIDALEPKQKKTFMDVIHDIISYFKSKFQKNKPIQTEIEKIENEFIKVYKEAVEVKVDEATEESYSFTGYAEDGRGKYKSNFPKGTPKMAKADKILNYIQNVWSKKPIKLKIEENGSIKYIEAKFDPTYDESGNIPTDASKLMGGNRHGTSSEQRVTLDLADDYYQIASESQYNYSKDETGKDNPTHKDVTKWHYFINDIYFAEYDSNEYEPYRVSINVKEKVDGEYVYSFSAEKERESDTPRTLHAVVNDGNNPDANVELSNNKLTQPELIVKDNISEDGDIYSIPSSTSAESLLESYENGEISRQEYLNALRKEKTLNPLEIANLSERDADTTPEHAKKKGESKGDGESNTYDSLLESDIFDDTFKKEVKENSFIKKYETVTNKETLKIAAKELDEGGLDYVNKWWSIKPERANLVDTAVGFILMDRYQRIGDYQSAIATAEKVREFGTASGQQVQIFSILGRLDPNTIAVYAQKELSKAFEEMVKTRTQKWIDKNADRFNLTDQELEFIRRRTLQASQLPEGRDKAIKLAEITSLLQDKLPPEKGQGLKTLQRMSMLLNAKTNIRNITGNGVMVPVFIFSDFFGSGIDKWVATKTGVRTTGNFDTKSVKGLKKGAFETMDDFRRHINTRNSEMDRFEIGSGKAFNEQHEGKLAKQFNEVAKVLNALDRFTSFCLEMGDRPFYEMWFINSLNNQMKLNNVSEATPEMVAIASSEALQRTWQDTNKVVKVVATTKESLNLIHIGGYGLGDVLIKFTKTPANLTKAIFDFSPIGLIKSIAYDGLMLKNAVEKGSFEPKMQKQFVDSFSKGITGTILYVLAAGLASAGALSGGGDEDKDVSNFEKYIQGIPEYSFKIAGKWWSYEWMQPVGAITATVADYMKSKESNPDNNFFENILEAIKAGGEVLYNQSFMKSIQNLFTADNIVDGLIDAILDDPSVYVPQLFSQVANVTDKYRRTTYEKNMPLENALNRVKVKIPGLRQTLPKSIDVLGREIPNSQKGVFNAFFNPANTFTDTSTPVTDHVYELYTKTKDKTLIPRVAPYSVTVKGITKNFTPEEKNDFQRISGTVASDILEIAFKSTDYKKLSDEEKVEFINDVYGFATKMAKSSIEYDYTTLSSMVGEYSNGKPILSESDYKELPEEAREMLAQQYFFNKTEIKFLDDYKALIQWYIKQAKE